MRLKELFGFIDNTPKANNEQLRSELPIDDRFSALLSSDPTFMTENRVLGATGAWRCLKLIGQSLARVDKYTKYKEDGVWKVNQTSHLNSLLLKPSSVLTGFVFYETLTAFAALYGNGYAYIKRRPDYRPYDLILLHPNDVTPVAIGDDFYYKVILPNRQMVTVDPMDLLHITSLTMDWPMRDGKNVYKIHYDNFKLGRSAQAYGVNFYEKGAHLPGYLHTEEHLSKKEANRIANEFDSSAAGNNSFRTPVLHSGLEYKHVKLTPRDALFIEISNLTLGELSRVFGVPMHLLSNLDRATFSNIEQQGFEFQEYTLEPWAKIYADELTFKLIPQRRQGYDKIVCDTRALRAGDAESRANYYTKMFSVGALNSDEIRAREGDNPRPGGDKYYTPVNVFTDEEREARMDSSYKEANNQPLPNNNSDEEE